MEMVINKNNKGQVALIVLLVSAVVLTLGLSASKKAITDTKVDKDEADLKNAFNVAESSINQYLSVGKTGASAYVNDDGSAKADISVQPIGSGSQIKSDGVVIDGQNSLFWLVDHNASGGIGTSYYKKSTTLSLTVDPSFTGALKIDFFYKNGLIYSVNRSGYYFSNATPVVNNYVFSGSKTVNITIGTEDALLLVITPIGGNTNLILSGSGTFPVQGEEITAVGNVGNGVKTQVKTVNKYDIPDFFTESVSSINQITP